MKTTYWFKKKEESFGWTPITWQGWASLLLWGCAQFLGLGMIEESPIMTLVVLLISTGVLLLVCDGNSIKENSIKEGVVKKNLQKKVVKVEKKVTATKKIQSKATVKKIEKKPTKKTVKPTEKSLSKKKTKK